MFAKCRGSAVSHDRWVEALLCKSGEDENTSLLFSFDLKGFVEKLRRSQEGNIFHQQMNG